MLKVYRNQLFLPQIPNPPPESVLYTCKKNDIFRWPLNHLFFYNAIEINRLCCLFLLKLNTMLNAKYENPYQNSEKIACIGQRLM